MTKRKHINLTEQERKELEKLIKTGEQANRVNSRARVLLLLDRSQGKERKIREVVETGLVSQGTVANLKRRYFEGGLSRALYDLPRPGAKPIIDGNTEAHLIALACSDPPEGRERWTLRLLADRLVELELVESISYVTVGSTLKKMNLSLGE
jgi:transposase